MNCGAKVLAVAPSKPNKEAMDMLKKHLCRVCGTNVANKDSGKCSLCERRKYSENKGNIKVYR